jgi:HSP20 family protein
MIDGAKGIYEEIERLLARDPLLREVLSGVLPRAPRPPSDGPDADLVECADRYVLVLDVPGARAGSVRVRVDGPNLLIEGEKPAARPEGRVSLSERNVGAFRREFLLPTDADGATVSARLDDGLLTVTLPRRGGATARDVTVESTS